MNDDSVTILLNLGIIALVSIFPPAAFVIIYICLMKS